MTPMTLIQTFLNRLKPGEPVFPLRAQDEFAPDIIDEWADKVDNAADDGDPPEAIRKARIHKANEARALAHEFRAWQTRNGCKVPD